MNTLEQLLRERIGLDAASIGPTLIERTMRLRMKARQITQPAAYLSFLQSSPAEWNELIEAVVVTETWFFRDHEPFAAFARLVREEWLPAKPARPLRILSVPCSTGEEPYSLVMTLLDAGLPPKRFQVDAVDLSERALERARAGVYGRNSFRGRALGFRDRYFRETKSGYELRRDVCACVSFRRANILADDFPASAASYDFLFCRNLLIYFDRVTQGRVLQKLHTLLAPRGVLFLGPAELPLVSGHGFTPANLPLAFACRRTGAETSSQLPSPKPLPTPPVPLPIRSKAEVQSAKAAAAVAPAVQSPAAQELVAARALADAGQLREAAEVCEAHLVTHGPNAQAFYLLGLITEADASAAPLGHTSGAGPHAARHPPPSALDYYRKALYLEPNHYESLLQLALLLEKQGDMTGASAFRRRLRRLENAQPRPMAGGAAADVEDEAPRGRAAKRRSERPPRKEPEL